MNSRLRFGLLQSWTGGRIASDRPRRVPSFGRGDKLPRLMPAIAVQSMLDLIGGTPLVRLRHLVEPRMADVYCKCEQFNPGGSLKDRIALSMIEAAEREGRIRPGESVIVEPTSGNTGVGLALVCAAKRLQAHPHHAGQHVPGTAALLRPTAPSCTSHRPPGDAGRGREGDRAGARTPAPSCPSSSRTRRTPRRTSHHRRRRSWPSSALACPTLSSHGVGTGGTITGVGQRPARTEADVQIVAVEPEKSAVLSGGNPR